MKGDDKFPVAVACGVIVRSQRILVAQRGAAMAMPLKWEFPGGKIEPNELPEEALAREILEELGCRISIGAPLSTVMHAYPEFVIQLMPYWCQLTLGVPAVSEHAALRWCSSTELTELDWAPADVPIVEEIRQTM